MITGAGGMITGLLFMVMAPGNRLRGDLLRETEEHGGILAYVGRFLKINTAIYTYLFKHQTATKTNLPTHKLQGHMISACSKYSNILIMLTTQSKHYYKY